MRKTFLLSILLLAAGIGGASAAQAGKDGTPAFVDAFAGNWMTYEPSLGAGGTCQLDLQKTPQGKNYAAGQTSCAGALSGVTAWGIVDQQLALLGADGKVAARLGGNQNRISGTLADGSEVVFERSKVGEAIHRQWSALDCIYLGYSSKCAPSQALSPPATGDAGKPQKISVLVKLNARAEPRPDAKVVSVIAPKTCLPVRACTTAANGAWCEVSEGGHTAWVSHKAIRLGKFPIVTFVSGCE